MKNGVPTPMRNAEFLPMYYFIPRRILEKCGVELNALPRNPQNILHSKVACDLIESDLFRLLIVDAVAYMVWPYMGFTEYMEVYSGDDPAWRFAHCPEIWGQELTDQGILPTAESFLRQANEEFGYVPEVEIDAALRVIVLEVMARHHINEVIQVAQEYRCFEDFDFRKSNQKTDFIRHWYHTRTRHPQISLEAYRENYAENHDDQEWDTPDLSQDVQETVVSRATVDQFKTTLSEKDMAILEMRMQGYTLEEIAEKLGYKNHSGVLKRIRKIGQAYEAFTGEDLGFEDSENGE
jgi:transposase-like protein